MILLRTILITGTIILFHRLVVEKNSFNIAKVIAFLLVTIVAIALLFIRIDALELYFPFFMVMALIAGKTLESINFSERKDEG